MQLFPTITSKNSIKNENALITVIPRRGDSRDRGISGPTQWSAPTGSTVPSRGGASAPARINEIARSSRPMTVSEG
jgi:hypothetical protein